MEKQIRNAQRVLTTLITQKKMYKLHNKLTNVDVYYSDELESF
jgi:hypothetical protein